MISRMTCEEFINMYWSQYILLEKEFVSTLHFLTLDSSNESAFSQAYSKLILELGSEIDVVFKQYCNMLDTGFKGRSIGKYKECINAYNPDFITQNVEERTTSRVYNPWLAWNDPTLDAPFWWTAYNKIKHSRTSVGEIDGKKQEYYKFANQKYTLLALAGLYQILVYTYFKIATDENKRIVTPMPGSRLFKLTGGMWTTMDFYDELAFHIDDGILIMETSTLHY